MSLLPEVTAAQFFFWVLLPFVLFAPVRWAVLAWLVMGNLDTTGPSVNISDSVGWMNSAKGIVFPLVLWRRLRNVPIDSLNALRSRLWLALILYVAIGSI